MGRQSMMILFRAQLATVEAEIRAKEAEITSLKAAREAAEARLEALAHTKKQLEEEYHGPEEDADDRDEQIG